MTKTTLIDIDGTLVDTPILWLNWFENKYKIKYNRENLRTFESFYEEFTKVAPEKDVLSFWNNTSLYDDLKPYTKAKLYVNKLKNQGYKIYFCSTCNFLEHSVSKRNFLEKYFSYEIEDLIIIRDKFLLNADLIIDDRPKTLEEFKKRNTKIKTILSKQIFNLDNLNDTYIDEVEDLRD